MLLSPPPLFWSLSPKPLLLNPSPPNLLLLPRHPSPNRHLPRARRPSRVDEVPVDEEFLERFAPKDKESEDEARAKNWKLRGWAPWEEVLSLEGDFARKSLNEGEEVPLKSPEAIEAFRMLSPRYREKRFQEMGITEDEWLESRFEMKGEKPDPLETLWTGPIVVTQVAPRDWPPRGWEVDREELEFIREAHRVVSMERVVVEELEAREEGGRTWVAEDEVCLERYKVFLKQYKEWVKHNKDQLEKESYKYDPDYYPGRRKRGKDYKEGMYELPFYYPGQICQGKVVSIALYQGAFVDIGGVYDGWVPIKGNDWFWLRHHIKVGMPVLVEILAKRDPYRFRFPIEMRFVHPNVDHLIFNRFEAPPIFQRDEDTNLDELRRDCGRAPIPKVDPETKPEEEPLLSNHPYVDKLWQIHVTEQMIIDDVEENPKKYKGKKLSELTDDEDYDEEKSIIYTQVPYKTGHLPKVILRTSVKELDLEAALAERKHHNKLRSEAIRRGEKYKIDRLNRNNEMDEYDLMHWRRSYEEREALIRDISCRQALGLPLEEPGRFMPESYFTKGQYDPKNPVYRYDYWGEPKNSEKSRKQRQADSHNMSIVGKGKVWNEMSYEEAIEQQRKRDSRPKEEEEEIEFVDFKPSTGDDDDDYELDLNSLTDLSSGQPSNGSESQEPSDEIVFEE